MPAKKRSQKQSPALPPTPQVKPTGPKKPWLDRIARPFAFLTLAALSSPISQATLAPVFGAIPSSENHRFAILTTTILAFLIQYEYKNFPKNFIGQCLAAWAFWIPVIQMYLFQFSDILGPQVGPGILGFLSCHTITMPAVYAAAEAIDDFELDTWMRRELTTSLPIIIGVWHFVSFERFFQAALPGFNTLSHMFTPVKMQLLIASAFAYLSPSKLSLLALPALMHTFLANPHFDSAITFGVLNQTLSQHNWTILDRRWSNTGYISVLESLEDQYRVMRCDHSLLGGEWLLTEERRKNEGWKVDEPIYSVFEMLEAVRLIETEPAILDAKAQALVIGLGVGTTPKALIAHGINTTIVELDPVVHEFATTYFNLPPNHTAIIRDAIPWVHANEAPGGRRYDYIIHDVFTGGAEPLSLFTDKFIRGLRTLLKPGGLLALNYAGDVTFHPTTQVLTTATAVFDRQCKIYRDTPPVINPLDDEAPVDEDFTNIIVFCRNTPGPIVFRKPTRADFLGSKSREHYMLPNPEYEIGFRTQDLASLEKEDLILKSGKEGSWSGGSTRHWHVMRKVIPARVWELW